LVVAVLPLLRERRHASAAASTIVVLVLVDGIVSIPVSIISATIIVVVAIPIVVVPTIVVLPYAQRAAFRDREAAYSATACASGATNVPKSVGVGHQTGLVCRRAGQVAGRGREYCGGIVAAAPTIGDSRSIFLVV
jgi:hypothetical protein